jgi:hypothetical protein
MLLDNWRTRNWVTVGTLNRKDTSLKIILMMIERLLSSAFPVSTRETPKKKEKRKKKKKKKKKSIG